MHSYFFRILFVFSSCFPPVHRPTLFNFLQTACQAKQRVAEWGMMHVMTPGWVFAATLFAVVGGWPTLGAPADSGRTVPVIYCTDLFHPHVDPDDHFDLATLYAMPELEIKGIVLDQGGNNWSSRAASRCRN